MIEIRFTDHAGKQIDYRQLSREQIVSVAAEPEQIVEESGMPSVAQSRTTENGKQYLVRVAFRDAEGVRWIITAYKTSRVSKYWQES